MGGGGWEGAEYHLGQPTREMGKEVLWDFASYLLALCLMSWKMVRPFHSLSSWFLITDQDLSWRDSVLSALGSERPGEVKDERAHTAESRSLLALVPGLLHRFTSLWPLFPLAPMLQRRNQGSAAALCIKSLANKRTFFPHHVILLTATKLINFHAAE